MVRAKLNEGSRSEPENLPGPARSGRRNSRAGSEASAPDKSMTLSNECVLVYVLRNSGVTGRLTSGKIEFHPGDGLRVYDSFGTLNEYISGARLRSWTVLRNGLACLEWSHVIPEDARLMAKEGLPSDHFLKP